MNGGARLADLLAQATTRDAPSVVLASVVAVGTGELTVNAGGGPVDEVPHTDAFTPGVGRVVVCLVLPDGDLVAIGQLA